MSEMWKNLVINVECAKDGVFKGNDPRAESCALHRPGIVHREIRHCDDLALSEILSKAEYQTKKEAAP